MYKVAVVGATGLVGSTMLKVLEERNFPVSELIPVASERSIGNPVKFQNKEYKIVSMADPLVDVTSSFVATNLRDESAIVYLIGLAASTLDQNAFLIRNLHRRVGPLPRQDRNRGL